jgi:long-chain acyl-CoA synthetase
VKHGLVTTAARTPAQLFWRRTEEWSARVALREKQLGRWRSITWQDYGLAVTWTAHGLRDLGLASGDVCSILADNRPEWLYTDMAALSLGAIGNGIYPTSSPQQVAYMLRDSESKIVVVENDEQLDKVLEVRAACPRLERIVVIDTEGLRDFADPQVMSFAELLTRGRARMNRDGDLGAAIDAAGEGDIAILVYTSGTTGPPKAAAISNAAIMAQIARAHVVMPLGPGDETLSFLPLCHIAERMGSVFNPLAYGATVNFAESPETAMADLREVAPTGLFAPPRVWERMYSTVTLAMNDALPIAKWAYRWASRVGAAEARARLAGEPRPFLDRCAFWLARAVVFKHLRQSLGLDRVRWAVTGAAPIAPELLLWFLALGLDIREAYGQTETAGLATINPPDANRPGTCGTAAPGVELRIDAAGEILIRGPMLFSGYRGKPEATAAAIDQEGWLHTGDVGTLDGDGYLRITDRLKDILITAGGKNIAPTEIENRLKASPYIADAVVIGDRRAFLTCLIMIDHETVAAFAQDKAVPFTNYASLCAAPAVRDLIAAEVARVNRDFARVEQIKDFRLIDVLLTPEDEELTPTMKLKRRVIAEKFASLIASMYGG